MRDLYNKSVEEGRQSLNHSLDETKRNIQTNIDEDRRQIPHYAQTFNELQEQAIEATKQISEDYTGYQKQAINSFQSVFAPYFENMNTLTKSNQDYSRRIPEAYTKIANSCAENMSSKQNI